MVQFWEILGQTRRIWLSNFKIQRLVLIFRRWNAPELINFRFETQRSVQVYFQLLVCISDCGEPMDYGIYHKSKVLSVYRWARFETWKCLIRKFIVSGILHDFSCIPRTCFTKGNFFKYLVCFDRFQTLNVFQILPGLYLGNLRGKWYNSRRKHKCSEWSFHF